MAIEIIIIAVMLVLSAFFSGVETAILSLSPLNIVRGSKTYLAHLYQRRELLIVVLLIGNNITIVSATIALENLLSKSSGVGIEVFGFVIQLILFFLFAEALPKVFFRKGGNFLLGYLYPLVMFFYYLLRPFGVVFLSFTRFLVRLFPSRSQLNREEIVGFIRSNFVESKDFIMEGFFQLEKTKAKEIMTPLPEFISFPEEETISEIMKEVEQSGYSRYPLFSERGDNITGYVDVKDFLPVPFSTRLSTVSHTAVYVPDTLTADRVRYKMQEEGEPMLFVVNEFGSVIGLITLENLAEELVGDIVSNDQANEFPDIIYLNSSKYILAGNLDIDDFSDYFRIEITKDGFETLNGYINNFAGRILVKDEEIRTPVGVFRVMEGDEKTIQRFIYRKNN